MIEVHAYPTPNSLKVPIALEEMGLDYRLVAVNLREGQHKTDAFRMLNPNAKVPVLIDRTVNGGPETIVSDSAAILVYLAEKAGQLLPEDASDRSKVFEQLFFHASEVSPAFLQAFVISRQSSPQADAQALALSEVDRVLGVLDHHLGRHRYVAGDSYSIADIAHFGWLSRHSAVKVALDKFPAVSRWLAEVGGRPAVVNATAKTQALAQ